MTAIPNESTPHFLIWEPFKRPPRRRKGDGPQSCMAALPLIGALVLHHSVQALFRKLRGAR